MGEFAETTERERQKALIAKLIALGDEASYPEIESLLALKSIHESEDRLRAERDDAEKRLEYLQNKYEAVTAENAGLALRLDNIVKRVGDECREQYATEIGARHVINGILETLGRASAVVVEGTGPESEDIHAKSCATRSGGKCDCTLSFVVERRGRPHSPEDCPHDSYEQGLRSGKKWCEGCGQPWELVSDSRAP